ncbi:40S ribosomal protein S5-1 [Hordeum vulgare]|nr:40S ribosomal protein S5-1 [Hordeum vulgare]
MREGMLHIRDVEGPKKTRSMETRLEAMEQQVFKCEGMVERGLNANHMMITEFTNKHKVVANDIGKHLSRLYDRVDQLQGQIYDLQNQNCAARMAAKAEAARNRPPPVPQLRTQAERMEFLVRFVQGMEKNIQEILQRQKSLERFVENKFHEMD